jgi:hypothetical protein
MIMEDPAERRRRDEDQPVGESHQPQGTIPETRSLIVTGQSPHYQAACRSSRPQEE